MTSPAPLPPSLKTHMKTSLLGTGWLLIVITTYKHTITNTRRHTHVSMRHSSYICSFMLFNDNNAKITTLTHDNNYDDLISHNKLEISAIWFPFWWIALDCIVLDRLKRTMKIWLVDAHWTKPEWINKCVCATISLVWILSRGRASLSNDLHRCCYSTSISLTLLTAPNKYSSH